MKERKEGRKENKKKTEERSQLGNFFRLMESSNIIFAFISNVFN